MLSNCVYNYHINCKGEDFMQKKSELALRLKVLRREKGVTSQQVADALGIKSATYRRYEIDTKPKDDVYIALAEYFGVTVDYLMSGRAGNMLSVADSGAYAPASARLSKEETALVKKLRTLSEQDFKEVQNFVDWKCICASNG